MPLLKQIDHLSYRRGPYGSEGRCMVRLFDTTDAGPTPYLVIATDIGEDNPGPSVTNAAELVAESICDRFGLAPDQLTFVEHYDGRIGNTPATRRRDGVEDFDQVTFASGGRPLSGPNWTPIRKAEVERMIGVSLP